MTDALSWVDEFFTEGGNIEVQDDIAKSGGDGTPIDRVQGINGVGIETADTLGVGEVWLKRGGGTKLRAGRPVLPGWYDPLDYGCPWDGVHDDLPGFLAMIDDMPAGEQPVIVHLPYGRSYFSDNLRIKRALDIRGHAGGYNDANGSLALNGMRFAPLKGIIFESYYTTDDYPVSLGAQGARLEGVTIESTQVIVMQPVLGHGAGHKMLDTSTSIRVASTFYELGEVVLATGGNSPDGADADAYAEGATRGGPTVMFRCTNKGTTSSGGQPGAFATATVAEIGDTITDGSATWTVESVPKDYLNDETYVVGQRVFLPGDSQCYFECIAPGTSLTAGAPTATAASVGVGVLCPAAFLSPTYGQEILDDDGNPGDLKWRVYFPSGVNILTPNVHLERFVATGFTGYGVYATSALSSDAYPASAGFGFADFTYLSNYIISYCGGGLRFNGSDGGGGATLNGNFLFLGLGRTNVDAAAYLNLGEDVWGTGVASILDRALGGNTHTKAYSQFSTGIPFRNDTLAGSGTPSRWDSCVGETTFKLLFLSYPVVTNCVPQRETGPGIILGADGRGIQETDLTLANATYCKLSNTPGGIYAFRANTDLASEWGWKYDVSGYWQLKYSGSNPATAFKLAGFGAGSNPGVGWLTFNRGYLLGYDPATSVYRGDLDAAGLTASGLKDRTLRAGLRRAGDRFESGTAVVTITSEGYRGEPWTALTSGISDGYEPIALPPYIVEPTANGVFPPAGKSVWKCSAVTTGITGAGEPTWSSATPDGGTSIGDTIVDAGVTWELVGFTPHFDVEQRTDKATIPTRLTKKQTTTSSASQVIESGGVLNLIDLALPPDSMVIVTDIVVVKKASTANGGSIEVKSVWVRNGTGAPTEIGTHTPVYNLDGSTLDGTTVAHVANGNRIELQASPESADTLNWRVFRTQATGED